MAVDLADLVPRLKSSLTVPGSTTSLFDFTAAQTDGWVDALANAFWWARMHGLFVGFRVNDVQEIVNVTDGGDDLGEQYHQIVVLFAAIASLETKIAELPTGKRATAGPTSTETQRSAQVLDGLLKSRRAELEQVKKDLRGTARTTVGVIDLFLARTDTLGGSLPSDGYWLR